MTTESDYWQKVQRDHPDTWKEVGEDSRVNVLANRVADVLADAADVLGLMHVTVNGDRVHAYHVWAGPGVQDDRELAFTVVID